MAKREPGELPEHIEVLHPTWTEGEGDVRPPERPRRLVINDRLLGRLAWFSVIATMTTVLVAVAVVAVSVAVLLSEPEPIVFDRHPPPPQPIVVRRLRVPTPDVVPPVSVVAAEPEAALEQEAAPLWAPSFAPPPLPDVPHAPAPQLPTDLKTQTLVPGELPGGMSDVPTHDTSEEAAQALGAERVTVRIGSEPPGADVRVDGRFRGRTPVKLLLNPGRYDIRLELPAAKTRWTLEATTDERRCFVVDGDQLIDADCA